MLPVDWLCLAPLQPAQLTWQELGYSSTKILPPPLSRHIWLQAPCPGTDATQSNRTPDLRVTALSNKAE